MSRTDGSSTEGRAAPLAPRAEKAEALTLELSGKDQTFTAGIKPGLPSVVLTLAPADKPDLRDLHTHRPSSTVGISEEYVNSPHDWWRV